MVLGGIVLLPMIGFATWKTHSDAQKIESAAKELERANTDNLAAIRLLKDRVSKVALLIPQFQKSVMQLSTDLDRIRKKLFPFGWVTRLWRRTRSYFVGYYYSTDEMNLVEELGSSVDCFLSQFNAQSKSLSDGTAGV